MTHTTHTLLLVMVLFLLHACAVASCRLANLAQPNQQRCRLFSPPLPLLLLRLLHLPLLHPPLPKHMKQLPGRCCAPRPTATSTCARTRTRQRLCCSPRVATRTAGCVRLWCCASPCRSAPRVVLVWARVRPLPTQAWGCTGSLCYMQLSRRLYPLVWPPRPQSCCAWCAEPWMASHNQQRSCALAVTVITGHCVVTTAGFMRRSRDTRL